MARIKKSAEYRALYRRFAGSRPIQPSESWVEDQLCYVVFDLLPSDPEALVAPLALFVVDRPTQHILLVRVVTPSSDASTAEVIDLYREHGGNQE